MKTNIESIRVGTLKELEAKRCMVVRLDQAVAVFHNDGKVFAVENRCPHMGFPLHRGSVEDGILTCYWHHARFDLASGCTFHLWADDVPKICHQLQARRKVGLVRVLVLGSVPAIQHAS